MKTNTILAIVLIVIGIVAFGYQGITYTTKETVVDIGPLKIDAEKTKTFPLPPIVGGISLLGGIALLLMGRKNN